MARTIAYLLIHQVGLLDQPGHQLTTRPTRLRRLVSDQVNVILRRTIDPDRALSEYGLDSLGNLELRTHLKAETGVRVTSADITTIQGLAALLCEKLATPKIASLSS